MRLRRFLLDLRCLRGSQMCLGVLRRSCCCGLLLFLCFCRIGTWRFGCLGGSSMRRLCERLWRVLRLGLLPL